MKTIKSLPRLQNETNRRGLSKDIVNCSQYIWIALLGKPGRMWESGKRGDFALFSPGLKGCWVQCRMPFRRRTGGLKMQGFPSPCLVKIA
ncbi:hypothetical protein A7Q09_05425 [Methylacidiphilum sp. Yel]|nr:hypothetical protein A7Q09_05425 [Methylacidiphilum sp. Yel]